MVNFADSMYSGVTALMYSAEFFPEDGEEEEEPSKFETWLNDHLGTEKFTALITSLAVILGLCMSIGLFFLLPTVLGGLVSRVCKYNVADSLKIGVGMMTRGEVALIVAQKGLAAGMLTADYFTAVILLIIVSSILTPIILKVLYSRDDKKGIVQA